MTPRSPTVNFDSDGWRMPQKFISDLEGDVSWMTQWAHQADAMDAGQRTDIAHHIGLLIIQANKAGALDWGSTIYRQAILQTAEAFPYFFFFF